MAISRQEMNSGAPSPTRSDAAPDPAGTSMTVDDIMRRIHGEVLAAGGALPASAHPASSAPSVRLATWQPSAPRIAVKQQYVLGELLAFSDRDFIDNAYRAVLRRGADEGGMSHHLTRLRNGQESKVGILAALRWSPEGEKAGVHVDGLLAPFLLQKWRRKRFIGPLIGWVHSLARLGSIPDRQVVLDAAQAREDHELGRVFNLQAQQLEKLLAESESARMLSSRTLEALSTRMDAAIARLSEFEAVNAQLASLSAGLAQVRAHSIEVADQAGTLSSRLDMLAEVGAHSHAVAAQVGALSLRMGEIEQVRAHSSEVAAQVGALSLRMNEVADLRAHSNALAGHVGTLSTRLDELSGVRAHSHEVAHQVGTLSTRLDALGAVADQARTLAYRIDTLTARIDGQPDVVPVIHLLSERLQQLSHLQDDSAGAMAKGARGVVRGR